MHNKGYVLLLEQDQPLVVGPWSMYDNTIHRRFGSHVTIGAFLIDVLNHRKQHVITIAGVYIARTCNEIGENRITDFVTFRSCNDVADCKRSTGSQIFGAGAGAVIIRKCCSFYTVARGLAHLRIVVLARLTVV